MDLRIVVASLSLLAAAALMFGTVASALWQSFRIRRWRAVEGRILESRPVPEPDGYRCHVEYEYTVDGARHVGTTIGPGQCRFPDELRARQALLPFSKGFSSMVHVNPQNAGDAVIRLQAPRFVIARVVCGVLLSIIGVGILFLR